MPHKRALHAAGFLCQPAAVCQIKGNAANGQHACYGKQAIQQPHVVELFVEAFLKCCSVLAYADAAQYFTHLPAHVASQATLLGNEHAEQAQPPATVLWRGKDL